MAATRIGTVAELDDRGRLAATVDGVRLTAFRAGDAFVAYENLCPHLGGPVCDGKLARRIEVEIAANGEAIEHFSQTRVDLVCPWHGFEFDLASGVAIADPRYALRSFPIECRGDELYVSV
ncbi:MAG TPA: Rieske 2Fe-2S domain-containing protein [Solirubrobacteraceae bacterium]|nr:Rieske 2Fe-2S domain-containing protein [Solirubrobacteraceae bacterium]